MNAKRFWLVPLAALSVAVPAAGQETEGPSSDSLAAHFGVRLAARRLESSNVDERLRALERLGTAGTARAIELLARALEPDGQTRTPEERLTAVRALAPHVASPKARLALVRVVTGTASDGEGLEIIDWTRHSAALALAASGEADALRALGQVLKSLGPAAEAARVALLAYPPRDIAPVLDSRGRPSALYVDTLADLGDQRAFETLRSLVRRGPTEVRARAAIALTRLGHYETVPLARHWLAHERAPALRVSAAEILVLARTADAPKAVLGLLRSEETESDGSRLAGSAPTPALVPELVKGVRSAPPEQAASLIAAVGRAGGSESVKQLAAWLSDPERASAAAYALSIAPGDGARDAIVRGLSSPSLVPLALRAAAVRRVALGESIAEAKAVARREIGAGSASVRAAAALALAALEPDQTEALLDSEDPVIVRSAARTLLVAPVEAARAAARRLAVERDPSTVDALALCLARPGVDALVPSSRLAEVVERGGGGKYLAAKALASRYETRFQPLLSDLLENGETWLKSHTALGLGEANDTEATSLLAPAYRFQSDPLTRRAVVRALSNRGGAASARVLHSAATLDPDSAARSAARLSLSGARFDPGVTGIGTAWLTIRSTGGGATDASAAVLTAAGLGLPVVPDPDGALVILGFPRGPIELRVAAASKAGKAPSSRERGGKERKER